MGNILSDTAVKRIKRLKKKFKPYADKGWLAESGECDGQPCINIFNNSTDELIRVSPDGRILNAALLHTAIGDVKEMAELQSQIYQITEND